jgi:hypothetical protein
MAEHAVIVHFDYGSTELSALFELEDQLEEVILAAGVGEFDGNEMAVDGSDGFLYMYGPDADTLFSAIKTTLAESTSIRNAVATLRYGPAADDTRRVEVAIER